MATRPGPKKNHILATLPAEEWARWLPALGPVDVPLGQVLYESGLAMTHVYFPTMSILSLLCVLEDGASAEIAVVGNEGIVGISLFKGGETTPSRSVVQDADQGLRMRRQLLKEEFNRSCPVLHLLLRYTPVLLTQLAQAAVSNRHHPLSQYNLAMMLLYLEGGPCGGGLFRVQAAHMRKRTDRAPRRRFPLVAAQVRAGARCKVGHYRSRP